MTWLLILLVVVALVLVLWLLTARRTAARESTRPHRLDDSLFPSVVVAPASTPDLEPNGADSPRT